MYGWKVSEDAKSSRSGWKTHTFAALIFHAHGSCNATANVPALGYIATLEANVSHQLVKHAGIVISSPVPIQRGSRGEGISRQRWNDQVVWQSAGRIFLLKLLEDRKELQKTP